MKTTIRVSCVDQVLKFVERPVLASGGLNEAVVVFDFCEKWNGFAKTCVFYRSEDELYHSILDDDGICVVPWEVYSEPGSFYFTIFGDKGEVRRTTNTLKYKAQKGLTGSDMIPSDPSPEVYDQILARMSETEEQIANAVKKYLDENEIEAGATAEEAAQIKKNKADIETLNREKLSADALPSAVNDALAQAKASGEFKGDPGDDYVLTEADKQEIAGMVEVPEGGTVTDAQIASAVENYLAKNPVQTPSGMSSTTVNLLIKILKSAQYSEDQTENILALETALKTGDSGVVEPTESDVEQIGNILSIVSGVTVTQTENILTIE